MENSTQENLQQPKLPRMKILEETQKNLATVGIHPNLLLWKACPFNGKNLLGFLLLEMAFVFNVVYFFFEAKTPSDRTLSIYMVSVSAIFILYLLILILNAEKLFELINDCENKIVNTSECGKSNELRFSSSISLNFPN